MLGLGVGALAGLTIIAFDLAADPHEQRDLWPPSRPPRNWPGAHK
jgi:hypothetical protein